MCGSQRERGGEKQGRVLEEVVAADDTEKLFHIRTLRECRFRGKGGLFYIYNVGRV